MHIHIFLNLAFSFFIRQLQLFFDDQSAKREPHRLGTSSFVEIEPLGIFTLNLLPGHQFSDRHATVSLVQLSTEKI